jgi:hypothetical protein
MCKLLRAVPFTGSLLININQGLDQFSPRNQSCTVAFRVQIMPDEIFSTSGKESMYNGQDAAPRLTEISYYPFGRMSHLGSEA